MHISTLLLPLAISIGITIATPSTELSLRSEDQGDITKFPHQDLAERAALEQRQRLCGVRCQNDAQCARPCNKCTLGGRQRRCAPPKEARGIDSLNEPQELESKTTPITGNQALQDLDSTAITEDQQDTIETPPLNSTEKTPLKQRENFAACRLSCTKDSQCSSGCSKCRKNSSGLGHCSPFRNEAQDLASTATPTNQSADELAEKSALEQRQIVNPCRRGCTKDSQCLARCGGKCIIGARGLGRCGRRAELQDEGLESKVTSIIEHEVPHDLAERNLLEQRENVAICGPLCRKDSQCPSKCGKCNVGSRGFGRCGRKD